MPKLLEHKDNLEEAPALLTYEQYMAEGETMRRCEILDGVRTDMPNPTRQHQRRLRRIARILEDYENRTRLGQCIIAPCDILIAASPLRTRQPDVLYISNQRLEQNPPSDNPAPLSPAPEFVVEILSPSDTKLAMQAKLDDYGAVGVRECLLVNLNSKTLELLLFTPEGIVSLQQVGVGEVVTSTVFEGLEIAISEVFDTTD